MKRQPSRLLRILTNSERTSSACARRWWWRYHLGFSGFDSPAPLRQGSLVHRMLAAWYWSGMVLTIDELARDVVGPWQAERRAHVIANLPERDIGDRLAEDMEIAQTALGLVGHYLLHWGDRDRAAWEVIAVEASFARGIPHPKTGKPIVVMSPDGKRKTWVHGGQVDLLIRDRTTGLYWFVEHKTMADEDFEGYFRKLHLDTQVRGYAWALRAPIDIGSDMFSATITAPVAVVGVIYNAIRKAVPRVPPLLKPKPATRNNPHPVSEGLSRAKIDTTRDMYLATILANGFDPGAYADILADLESKRFFGRQHYPITDRELDGWIVDHARWALETAARTKLPIDEPPPMQTSLCNDFHRRCEFASLCIEDGLENRRSFRVRTVRHEELPGAYGEPSAMAERVALGVVTASGERTAKDPVERLQAAHARAQEGRALSLDHQIDDPFA